MTGPTYYTEGYAMTTTTLREQAQGIALVLAAAHKMGLPEPSRIALGSTGADINLAVADLREWATWIDEPISEAEPSEYVTGRWFVVYKAAGTIYDLPVALTAHEFGVMVESDSFSCEQCGASFGSSAGFVADGTYDDWFETRLTYHMDGTCVGAGVAR